MSASYITACDVLYAGIISESSSGGRCEAPCQGPCVTQVLEYLSNCEGVPEHDDQTSAMRSIIIDPCLGMRIWSEIDPTVLIG